MIFHVNLGIAAPENHPAIIKYKKIPPDREA
jgi:hypothetical protein